MSDQRAEYLMAFTERAEAPATAGQPGSPALLLFFGDIALGCGELILRKLMQHLPPANRGAVVAGCLGSQERAALVGLAGEGGLPCLPMAPDGAERAFGDFAAQWLGQNREQASQFARRLLLRVTEKATAQNMAIVDAHLIVGNDGGACELWPAMAALLAEAAGTGMTLRLHLLWLCRELLPQPRDGAMSRLARQAAQALRSVREAFAPTAETAALFTEGFPVELLRSVAVFTDRNGMNVCSDKVWAQSAVGMAAFVLNHLYGATAQGEAINCASIDMVYPDEYWAAGFQLSALLRLTQQLEQNEARALPLFMPTLLMQPAWRREGAAALTAEHFAALAGRAMPSVRDLYTLPLNTDLSNGDLRGAATCGDCERLLFGTRLDAFFQDALEGESLANLIDLLWAAMEQAIRSFALHFGPAAAFALTQGDQPGGGLPEALRAMESSFAAADTQNLKTAPMARQLLPNLAARRAELLEKYGQQRIRELRRKAALAALQGLRARLGAAAAYWRSERDALRRATLNAKATLLSVFDDVRDYAFYASLQRYGESGRLFTDGDRPLGEEVCALLGDDFARRGTRDNERAVLGALTRMNLDRNDFLTFSLREAFTALEYLNGFNELFSAMRERCVPTVFSTGNHSVDDFWITPTGESGAVNARRSAGDHIVELIRSFRSGNGAPGLFETAAYLKHLTELPGMPVCDLPLPEAAAAQIQAENAPAPAGSGSPAGQGAQAEAAPLTTRYTMGRTLIFFPWPADAQSVRLKWVGEHAYGEQPQISEIVVSHEQYRSEGGASVPCRLLGPFRVTTLWYVNGANCTREDRMTGDRDYVSFRVQPTRGPDGKPSANVELRSNGRALPFHQYFVLLKRSPDGRVVRYRLPQTAGVSVLLEGLQPEPGERLEIDYLGPSWKDYFTLELQ